MTLDINALQNARMRQNIENNPNLRLSTEDKKLKEASEEFEAIFVQQMLSSMRKNVQKSGLLDGGMAENIFEDMLYQEHAKIMAKTGSFGIAEAIYNQMKV